MPTLPIDLDANARQLISLALREDLGPGDITSSLIDAHQTGSARILAKESLVLAGVGAFSEVYRQVGGDVVVEFVVQEGEQAQPGTEVGRVTGNARAILVGERTALNLLQRLSGIATLAHQAQAKVATTHARVVDTRKTTPGLRSLEKHAVRVGGAYNHRFGLFDGALIKDNHIRAAGSITQAVRALRHTVHHLMKVECEVTTLAEVDEALAAGVDVILLDNMEPSRLREAVTRIHGRALVEASGGITLDTLAEVAKTGVDLISMGALTHSARAVDLSLDWTSPSTTP